MKVSVKGQVLIPASLRRKYRIQKGTPLRVYDERSRIILEPIISDLVAEGWGMLKTKGRILRTLIKDRKREARQ